MATVEGTDKHILWQTILGEIELSVSRAAYATWFKNTKLVELEDDGSALIAVPNIFAKQQFEVKFDDKIKDCLKNNGTSVKKIKYIVGNNPKKPANNRELVIDTVKSSPGPSVSRSTQPVGSGLNPRYTFDNYIVGSSNDLAYAACQSVATNPGTKYNPLFIYGGVGLGKTHLIQAVGNQLAKTKPELKILYINSETFVNEFLDHIRFKKKGFSDKYRSVDVLIVDDMQFIAGKEKTQEEFFHTFNALHQANKQIIISSDKPPKSIPTLTERLRSRFEWGMAIDIQMPDFETRCAIIETKASLSDVNLSRDTVEFLANNIKTNIRELEGALNQLLAFSEMRGLEPDIKTAAGLIGNVRTTRPHHLTPKQVIDRTAKYFEVDAKDVVSPMRDKHIALPRQIAMYLLRSELHLSFPRIAKELGRKDHTTAIHSVNKIEKAIKLDFMIRENVAEIRERLYA
ncbi:MAG TPA: chromosomal replication initiator protein DnaA [Candidatus Saccharimonadales bacterium]|nr:chromosomal replication initiator protein DnaA [Candidatus Saccharimonadales bacterium]